MFPDVAYCSQTATCPIVIADLVTSQEWLTGQTHSFRLVDRVFPSEIQSSVHHQTQQFLSNSLATFCLHYFKYSFSASPHTRKRTNHFKCSNRHISKVHISACLLQGWLPWIHACVWQLTHTRMHMNNWQMLCGELQMQTVSLSMLFQSMLGTYSSIRCDSHWWHHLS